MRKFLDSKFFKFLIALSIICIGAATYTFSFNSNTPAVSFSGMLFAPVENVFTNISIYFSNIYTKSFEIEQIIDENTQMHSLISKLESEIRSLENYKQENSELKTMLGIKTLNPTFDFELCEVVGRNISSTSSVLTLDKGENAGIEVNDCVITDDGLVGYITRVGPNYSQLITVLDPSLAIGSIADRSRQIGVCEGSLSLLIEEHLKLSYLDKNADILVGDTIETSGVSGIYPKGILIGEVVEISVEDHGSSQYAKISPSVDVNKITSVYVIKSF